MKFTITLCRPMDSSIKFDTVQSGWSIVPIEGSQVILSKNFVFLSLKIDFGLANSADPDEMPQKCGISSGSSLFAKLPIFHQGLHCLQKYPFRGFQSTRV